MLMIIKQEKGTQLVHKSNERNLQSSRLNSHQTEPSSSSSRATTQQFIPKRFTLIFMNQAIQVALGPTPPTLAQCLQYILKVLEAEYEEIEAYLLGLHDYGAPVSSLTDVADNGYYELKLGRIGLSYEAKLREARAVFSRDGETSQKEELQMKQIMESWRAEVQEAVIKEKVLVFDDNSSLAIHALRFERKKGFKRSYKCPFFQCNKCFSESGNLRTHLRTHTNSRPFKCDHCDKQFITKCHLTSHMLTHTGDRPFVCPFEGCGKNYPRSGRLKIHMRSHTGQKPYKCPFEGCKKSFTERGNLKTHMRIHENNKPHICPKCEKRFITNAHLKDHMSTHSHKKPFICKICKKFYKRTSTLNVHLKQIHAVDPKDYMDNAEYSGEDGESENSRNYNSSEEEHSEEEEWSKPEKVKRERKMATKRKQREQRCKKESNVNSIKIPIQLGEEQKPPSFQEPQQRKMDGMKPLLMPAQLQLIESRRASFVSCPQIIGNQVFTRPSLFGQRLESPEEQRRRQSVENPLLLPSQLDVFKDTTPVPNFDHLFASVLTPQSKDYKLLEQSTPIAYRFPFIQPSPIQHNPQNMDFLKMVFQGGNSVQNSPFSTLQSQLPQSSPSFKPVPNPSQNPILGKLEEWNPPQVTSTNFQNGGGDSTYQALKFPGISPISGNIGCEGSLNFSTAFSNVKCKPPSNGMSETPLHGRLPFVNPQNVFHQFPWLNTPQSRSVPMRKDSMTPGGAFSIPTGNLFMNVQSFEEAANMNEEGPRGKTVGKISDLNTSPKRSLFSHKRN